MSGTNSLTSGAWWILLALLFFQFFGCSDETGTAPGVPTPTSRPALIDTPDLPATIEIAEPEKRITNLTVVEESSEEVANGLHDFAALLRKRDLREAAEWLDESFAGHALTGLATAERKDLIGDIEETKFDAASASIVGRAGFVDSLSEWIGGWQRVEAMLWKVKGAEFNKGAGGRWGTVKLYLHAIGIEADGARVAYEGWGALEVKRRGKWRITRLRLDSWVETRREAPFFTEVTTAVGVEHRGPRFGTDENNSYHFNGAASADVNGDGRFDIFLPSDGRNFLYIARADGTYAEEAKARGVAAPDAGTGAIFFDFDNDRDLDLAVGHVSWPEEDGAVGGTRIQLYENDGKGQFKNVSDAFGFEAPVVCYSLTAFDYDLDGWLDLYACGYGRVEVEHNDDWIEATNGSPNALFRNEAGKRFVDVAKNAGVRGEHGMTRGDAEVVISHWSYASAAADVDDDGDLDLYVANDYGSNRLYRNDGNGKFTDAAEELGVLDQGNGMGVSFGDLSGDGLLDLYVSNMSSTAGNRIIDRFDEETIGEATRAILKKLAAGNTIFFRDDSGTFEALPAKAGGVNANWAWSSGLADYDLDGRLDVFCANGFVTGDTAHDT